MLSTASLSPIMAAMNPPPSSTVNVSGLPSPPQLRAFLATHHGIEGLATDQPHQFWPDTCTVEQPPFNDTLVLELRGHIRHRLRQVKDAMVDERATYFGDTFRCNDRSVRIPTSEALFEASSAHQLPWHRLGIAMRMGRITAETAAVAMDSNCSDPDPLREYLKGKVTVYEHCDDLAIFLGVDPLWIEHGPTVHQGFEEPPLPWWLEPWWELSELADDVFALAIRRGMLRVRGDGGGYDFASFWACWQADPQRLVLPPMWATRPLELLPWLFEARVGFRCGNPTFNSTFTAETWDTLQRLMNWYMIDGLKTLGEQAGKPPANTPPTSTAPPTSEEMMRLKLLMSTSPSAIVQLKAPDGTMLQLSPVHTQAPDKLACDRGKPSAGRPPGKGKEKKKRARARLARPRTAGHRPES